MPTKNLPPVADLTHLKHQAKDLRKSLAAASLAAFQRTREFHPRFAEMSDAEIAGEVFSLSDAQLVIAREYGYASWPRLRAVLAGAGNDAAGLIHNDRIDDPLFSRAVDFLDAGQASLLKALLAQHPGLVTQKMFFEGDNYFTDPVLLEFIAENPVRQGRMPENIVEVARVILEAGGAQNADALERTLGLVASGRVAREMGQQEDLIDLLVSYGADPGGALVSALGHGEFGAVRKLLDCGAPMTVVAAAGLGDREALAGMLPAPEPEDVQLALAVAALHGRAGCIAELIAAGADPNRYNPPGGHSHTTALHSAALAGHVSAVRALVAGGARADIPDIHHQSTSAGWARFAGHVEIAEFLEGQSGNLPGE